MSRQMLIKLINITVLWLALGLAGCSKDNKTRHVDDDGSHLAGTPCEVGSVEDCDYDGRAGLRWCLDEGVWSDCGSASDFLDSVDSDSASDSEEVFVPPEEKCPEGTLELNIKDMWTDGVTPRLTNKNAGGPLPFPSPATTLRITTDNMGSIVYGAKLHQDNCDYYRTCIPKGTTQIFLQPNNPANECGDDGLKSAPIDISAVSDGNYLTMSHEGTNEEVTFSYFEAGYQNQEGTWTFSKEAPETVGTTDPLEYKPSCTAGTDSITLHIRWPWGDPDNSGFAGTGCEQDMEGITTPAYPPSLIVKTDTCATAIAILERNDGFCPWYQVSIPRSEWEGGTVSFRYSDQSSLGINPLDLPATDGDEVWLVYEGPVDKTAQGTPCNNYSFQDSVWHFYTSNLGPGYPGCGGAPAPDDCSEISPLDSSVVHFRYMWAGQKTFTYFPRDDFMPSSMFLHVNGTQYPCVQEGESPWFRCPIPNSEFFAGSKWRAVDNSHSPEWNTVEQLPTFPEKPGSYWMRWYYGKPDIPATAVYDVTTYYPDGVEWAQSGSWGDDFCFSEETAVRPPIESDGFFPFDETNYEYGFGQSIAKWYDNPGAIQNLMNYFVWERYLLWKDKYVKEGAEACGEGTARVDSSDSVSPTVSEGQGYGMAITAAIGDKELFDKLWRFVNHFLSQGADKYCGGLMGWDWKGPDDCQEYGVPSNGDGQDSAFDGDVDIAIGLVYAAWQWPEYTQDAVDWLLKMECEINTAFDGAWYYPTPGDTWTKNCANYPNEPCSYEPGREDGKAVNMSYYPPGYFRVFGEFLAANLNPAKYSVAERINHMDYWYHTAETTWELVERCYDDGIHPALLNDWGSYSHPCATQSDNYNWARGLWRLAVDAAWYGADESFYSTTAGSSRHFDGKSQMEAKMDAIQQYYAIDFPEDNPPFSEFANRFSTICKDVNPSGSVSGCDPGYDHNSYFVTTGMCSFATFYSNGSQTTAQMRREALEEAVSVAIQDDKYYQESLGLYQLLFLTGNFPRPYSRMSIEIIIQ